LARPAPGPDRLSWVDQLRTLAIVLVVNLHACVTYSHVGSWYIQEAPEPDLPAKVVLGFWEAHLQSFFMGLLFFVGGYFAQRSLARRGPGGFARERLLRLGVPTLFYMLVLHPLIVYGINPWGNDYGSRAAAYGHFLASGRLLDATGPMWFAAALLAFSAVLAAGRALRGPAPAGAGPAPGAAELGLWGLTAVGASFLVRTAAPIGVSFHNMQLCFFPQYILAFGAGVAAARHGWLAALAAARRARVAGWLALVLGPPALAGVLVAAGMLQGRGLDKVVGGWNLPALGYAAWEQLTGLGLALGFMSFCLRRLNEATPLARWLSARSFGVYLLHPVVLVLLTVFLRRWPLDPFLKVSLLTGTGLALSFLASDLARRVPGIRQFL
jgi:glucans biosynthesis protein C